MLANMQAEQERTSKREAEEAKQRSMEETKKYALMMFIMLNAFELLLHRLAEADAGIEKLTKYKLGDMASIAQFVGMDISDVTQLRIAVMGATGIFLPRFRVPHGDTEIVVDRIYGNIIHKIKKR